MNSEDLRRKAANVRFVITDCDGVLTDGGVYYSDRGEEMKRFHMRDGMGVKLLRGYGVETAIVTGETSPSVVRRAEKLGIADLHLGVRDKLPLVEKVLAEKNLDWPSVAYIGDDVNDLEVLRRAGFTACPSDGVDDVKEVVNVVLRNRGGNGAFREFAEMIMKESPSARPTKLP